MQQPFNRHSLIFISPTIFIIYILSHTKMSITLNPTLINNLNQLKQIPIPVTKLIIDQIVKSIINSCDGINYRMLERIINVEVSKPCNWKNGIKSLHYFFKFALKNQYPVKAINVFLCERTLLADLTEYTCAKYEQLQNSKIQPPRQAKLQEINWAAYNLRQNRNHEQINKMYMKLYMRTLNNGEEQEKVIGCQLPELKLILSQINQISTNIK